MPGPYINFQMTFSIKYVMIKMRKGGIPMKRLICTMLALCLLLCGCGGPAVGTTAPAETTTPVETTAPMETTVPPETTVPMETTAPVESTAPAAGDGSYILRIDDPDTEIYAGPSFVSGAAAMLNEVGAYTIVEEAADVDGNTWGKLKSGLGWVCLTVPPLAPIYADYADESFNPYHVYWSEETDYITSIGFTAGETLTDVRFGLLDWFEREAYTMDRELFTIDTMTPDQNFLAQVCFYGDMTTYGISFTDADGVRRHYAVSISGMDGSLLCREYAP